MNKLLLICPLLLAAIAAAAYAGFSRGPDALEWTGRELDVAIDGIGYFQVTHPSGQILYTRSGRLAVNDLQQLVLSSVDSELVFEPAIHIPADTIKVHIDRDGLVRVQRAGTSKGESAGKIQLARFENPKALEKRGENVFAYTPAAKPLASFEAEVGGIAEIRQFMLESTTIRKGR